MHLRVLLLTIATLMIFRRLAKSSFVPHLLRSTSPLQFQLHRCARRGISIMARGKKTSDASGEGETDSGKKGKKSAEGGETMQIAGARYDSEPGTFEGVEIYERQPLPKRDPATKELKFADYPNFRPNLTPKEIMQLGSFGGSYWRPIYSSVTKQQYDGNQWKEFPSDWFDGLKMKCAKDSYAVSVNKYKVKCGATLDEWEGKGWIMPCDPFGWFQWYCRFYLGRRCSDDDRQVGRGNRCFGPTGRWRIQLCNKIGRAMASAGKGKDMLDDVSISPVIRQTLQHWGFVLTARDYNKHAKKHGYPLVKADRSGAEADAAEVDDDAGGKDAEGDDAEEEEEDKEEEAGDKGDAEDDDEKKGTGASGRGKRGRGSSGSAASGKGGQKKGKKSK